jgi:hypothetical protein
VESPTGIISKMVFGRGFDPFQKLFLKKSRALAQAAQSVSPAVVTLPSFPLESQNVTQHVTTRYFNWQSLMDYGDGLSISLIPTGRKVWTTEIG